MKVYGIFVLIRSNADVEPVICCSSIDVSNVGFFQRYSAQEFMRFSARTVAKRITQGSMTRIVEGENVIYAKSDTNNLTALTICDLEYNSRVAFSLTSYVLSNFIQKFKGRYSINGNMRDNFISWPELNEILVKYQNPADADKILSLQREIDETTVIMHDAIDKILQRGEKIDDLVAKSEDLGTASRSFYRQARKTNSCCMVM